MYIYIYICIEKLIYMALPCLLNHPSKEKNVVWNATLKLSHARHISTCQTIIRRCHDCANYNLLVLLHIPKKARLAELMRDPFLGWTYV